MLLILLPWIAGSKPGKDEGEEWSKLNWTMVGLSLEQGRKTTLQTPWVLGSEAEDGSGRR